MICHLDTSTFDLDQITQLCKQNGLYEALIYVWNQALRDFITPLIDLLALVVPSQRNGIHKEQTGEDEEIYGVNAFAYKIFPYLSYILTGRVYPTGDPIPEDVAQNAKAELYWFLFSGKSITWPRGSSRRFLTRPTQSQEPSFPYLRMILRLDAPSFLSALNEAFEDSFLNDSPEKQAVNGSGRGDLPEEQVFGMTVDRQYIVSILTEIMNNTSGGEEFGPEDTIYLDMFIARNLPKYPQYLLFTGSTLTKVLTGLCKYPGEDLAEDAQLSAEYLLSVYQPPDLAEGLIPLFKEAGFYRILKKIYRVDKQYGKLVTSYFEDPDDREAVFCCIEMCLQPKTGLTKRQVQDVYAVLKEHSAELVELDPSRAAGVIDAYARELHWAVLGSVADQEGLQFQYLRTILEPSSSHTSQESNRPGGSGIQERDRDLVERYLQLMCRFDPLHVPDYVDRVQSTDLRLDKLLPAMEETGVIDAAVILMAKEGQVSEAMVRLVKHLGTLESALQGLLSGGIDAKSEGSESGTDPGSDNKLQESAEELMSAMQRYTQVGVWLCQNQTKKTLRELLPGGGRPRARQKSPTKKDALSADESLWLDLIDTVVQITRRLSSVFEQQSTPTAEDGAATAVLTNGHDDHQQPATRLDTTKLLTLLRSLVQSTFTALLASTSVPSSSSSPGTGTPSPLSPLPNSNRNPTAVIGSNLSFLRILKSFLSRAATSSPNLADLRAVLSSVFSAYAYEESILRLSNRLLERSLFVQVDQAVALRQRGWRPRGSTCEACGRRVWGPGVAGGNKVYEAWEEKQKRSEMEKRVRLNLLALPPGDGRGRPSLRVNVGGINSPLSPGFGDGGGENELSSPGGRRKGKGKDLSPRLPLPLPDEPGHGHQLGPEQVDGTTDQGLGISGSSAANGNGNGNGNGKGLGALVVLACRHVYHQNCLEGIMREQESQGLHQRKNQHQGFDGNDGYFAAGDHYHTGRSTGRERRYRCPIDG